ncbi:MAG: dihydrofolate reductase [Beijerinckiaceae bacterium]|nr:dihydrofolate reductase [Beijerinckiaceae bacterium]MDO9439619.1 dihydrofolate reductase [Beijerinckiaceae bacterium]
MSALPQIVLVAAVARNGVIGGDNRLLWKLSSDMRRFKALTMGKPMVMGRKTFESIGRPLPGRETIVVTRDPAYYRAGVVVANDLDAALAAAVDAARRLEADEIVVAGGGEIYRQAMDLADRIELTEVDLAPAGDTYFPAIDPGVWIETKRDAHPGQGSGGQAGDQADFAFVTYGRAGRTRGYRQDQL